MEKCSNFELKILKLVWSLEQPIDSINLHKAIRSTFDENMTEAKISVYINRMVKKQVLIQSASKGKYCTYTAVDKDEYQKFVVNREVIKNMGKSVEELVVALLGKEANEKSLEEVEKMIKLLSKKI